MVFQAVESVLSLLALVGVGWWIAGRSWFGASGAALFSKYTVQVAVPCYMFYNMTDVCGSREELLHLFQRVPLPAFVILCNFAMGIVLARALKVERMRRGVFLNVITFSNVVFVGFPVVSSLFGERCLPYAMIYYLANTVFFWTAGVWFLRRCSAAPEPCSLGQILRGIFSPPIVGMLLGVAAVLLQITVPDFLYTPITMLKNTATPIAMLFIGSVIRSTDLSRMKLSRDLGAVLIVRFLLSPALVGALMAALPLDTLMRQVFFLLSAMPAMTQLGVMAKETGSDYSFAAVLITVTTTVSMAVIPLYMALIQVLPF